MIALVLVGCAALLGLVVVLALTYYRESLELGGYDDERSIDRTSSTLDRLGCAAGHHRPVGGRCAICGRGER